MVEPEGLEPPIPKAPDFKSGVYTKFHHGPLVPEEGFEPPIPKTAISETAAYTKIPPLGHMLVRETGIEPARHIGHWILIPARLPSFRHSRRN